MHAPVRLLFVGGVSKEKGTRFLTRVLKALKVPFQLQVVGEGPDLPWLAKRFPKSVFHGRQSTAEILALMKTCDLLLVPSRILENQPTVILEAASVGLPVLATPRGGALETLGDLGWGPQHIGEWERGARDWARLIERLVHAPDGYQPLVERMRALAMQHDPDAYAAQFVSLLKSKA
jgi:glycosyltransferase involved in cell wall biosynthesis